MINKYLFKQCFLLLFVASCVFTQNLEARNKAIQDVTQAELIERMQSNKPPILIDVRSKKELQRGYIEGAKHIYIKEFKSHLRFLEQYKDKDIIVYCYKGPRAEVAEEILLEAGFKNVYDLKGHIKEWKKKKLPLIKPEK